MTCNDCIHYDACKKLLRSSFPNVTDEEIEKVTSRNNDCRVFKNKADVVEVVRCKDCIHAGKGTVTRPILCNKIGIYNNKFDYCSYGERREQKCSEDLC